MVKLLVSGRCEWRRAEGIIAFFSQMVNGVVGACIQRQALGEIVACLSLKNWGKWDGDRGLEFCRSGIKLG